MRGGRPDRITLITHRDLAVHNPLARAGCARGTRAAPLGSAFDVRWRDRRPTSSAARRGPLIAAVAREDLRAAAPVEPDGGEHVPPASRDALVPPAPRDELPDRAAWQADDG